MIFILFYLQYIVNITEGHIFFYLTQDGLYLLKLSLLGFWVFCFSHIKQLFRLPTSNVTQNLILYYSLSLALLENECNAKGLLEKTQFCINVRFMKYIGVNLKPHGCHANFLTTQLYPQRILFFFVFFFAWVDDFSDKSSITAMQTNS